MSVMELPKAPSKQCIMIYGIAISCPKNADSSVFAQEFI